MVGEEEKSNKLDLEETELRLGLPGRKDDTKANGKRGFIDDEAIMDLKLNLSSDINIKNTHLDFKNSQAQVVGWPPVRSYGKNILASYQKSGAQGQESDKIGNGVLVKVSMDGAPYLRKVDLNMYDNYQKLSDALDNMFSSFTIELSDAIAKFFSSFNIVQGMKDFTNERKLMDLLNSSDYFPTYEDKDGDWMLVGDVPWGMFVDSCKRLRIMKGTEAIGLAPRAMEKSRNRN